MPESIRIYHLDDIYENIEEIKKRLKPLGYQLIHDIDEGEYGVVYTLRDSQEVIKCTTDTAEISTSSKLVGKTFNHIVNIYRVFELKSIVGISFILEERMQLIPTEQVKVINLLRFYSSKTIIPIIESGMKLWKFKNAREYLDSSGLEFEDAGLDFVFKVLKPHIKNPGSLGVLVDVIMKQGDAEYLRKVAKPSNMEVLDAGVSGLQEMYIKGINFWDTHSGNFMKSLKGKYKWIDLGAGSKAEGAEKIDIIEALKAKEFQFLAKLVKGR